MPSSGNFPTKPPQTATSRRKPQFAGFSRVYGPYMAFLTCRQAPLVAAQGHSKSWPWT